MRLMGRSFAGRFGVAPQYDAIVVGAGFGGMGAGIELDRLGLSNFLILEREDDLGGTWHVNHYPGLAVDIASVTYSYSFEPNPNWSRLFAPGAELKKYAEHVAEKYDLRRRMRFDTVVGGARWDDERQHWVVAIENGESSPRVICSPRPASCPSRTPRRSRVSTPSRARSSTPPGGRTTSI